MADLILHIGWPKTGTSAIQDYLCQTPSLADFDLTYLRKGPRRPAYNAVRFGQNNPARLAEDHARLKAQADALTTRTALISAEVFATLPPAFVQEWLGAAQWDSIRIVAYLRRQDLYLESLYKQAVKWGQTRLEFDSFHRGTAGTNAAYDRVLARWQDQFPQAQITPRIFERAALCREDIVADFLATIGLPHLADTAPRRSVHNISPSAALLSLYGQLGEVKNLHQVNRRLVTSGISGVTGNADILNVEQRHSLLDRYAACNAAVRAMYFPDKDRLFTPPRPQSGPAEFDISGATRAIIDAIADINGQQAALAAQADLSRAQEGAAP